MSIFVHFPIRSAFKLLKRTNRRTYSVAVGSITCAVKRTTDGSHPLALKISVKEVFIEINPSVLTGGSGVLDAVNVTVVNAVMVDSGVVDSAGVNVAVLKPINVGVGVKVRVARTGVGVGGSVAVSV